MRRNSPQICANEDWIKKLPESARAARTVRSMPGVRLTRFGRTGWKRHIDLYSAFFREDIDFPCAFASFAELSRGGFACAVAGRTLRHFLDGHFISSLCCWWRNHISGGLKVHEK